MLNFESFFGDLLASVSLVNKMDVKVSTKTMTKTYQNLFRYISKLLVSSTCYDAVGLDTGHFFYSSLAQCLVFLGIL